MVILYLVFLISGVAGLIYQIVWSRLLYELFGVTVYAVTTVLATFLTGLSLGSIFLGRRVDHLRNPLHFYGLLEVGIGLLALLGLLLVDLLDPIHIWAANAFESNTTALILTRAILAALMVLPPTFLMGGTLPAMTRVFVGRISSLGSQLSLLYALNTLGAVIGSIACGFFMIRAFGLHATLYMAVALNLAAGVAAILLARGMGTSREEPQEPSTVDPEPEVPTAGADDRNGLLAVMILSGFASLGLEVLWTRLLVLVVGTSAYAFVTMLSSFLIGIALGGFVARAVIDRVQRPRHLFGWIQAGIAASVLATIPLGQLVSTADTQVMLEWLSRHWAALVAARFGISFAVMLVPATLIGMTFPIAGKLWVHELKALGGTVGQVYGANTIGNILGALVTGFALIPLLGLQKSVAVMVVLNIICAAWAFRSAMPALAGAGSVVFILLWQPAAFPMISEAEDDRLLYYNEGVAATVKVIQKAADRFHRLMGVDAIKIGESGTGVDEKQQTLAHVPFLLAPEPPEKVLSIGLGSGILVGEVATHPGIEFVDCIEISPSVIEGAQYFSDLNNNAVDNPVISIINDDGVNYLRRSQKVYDAIISDAKSRTGHSGNAAFFSREYYDLCHRRLAEDGIMIQWIPLNVPANELRTILATFLDVFEHSYAWIAPPHACYLVGTHQSLTVDLPQIERQLAQAPFAGLRRYGWTDPASFATLLFADAPAMRRALGDRTQVNSLEHPLLEFYSPRDFVQPSVQRANGNMRFFTAMRHFPFDDIAFTAGDPTHEYAATTSILKVMATVAADETGRQSASVNELADVLETAPVGAALKYAAADILMTQAGNYNQTTQTAMLRLAVSLWPDHAGRQLALGSHLLVSGNALAAENHLRQAVRLNPHDRDAHLDLASALRRSQRPAEGVDHMRAALRIDPNLPGLRTDLGRLLAEIPRYEEAVEQLEAAIRTEPSPRAWLSLGLVYSRLNKHEKAIGAFEDLLADKPDHADAAGALGRELSRAGRYREALQQLQRSLELNPGLSASQGSLAWVLATCPDDAIRDGEEAMRIALQLNRKTKFKNAEYLDAYAVALAEEGLFADALDHGQQAAVAARASNRDDLAREIDERVGLYRQRQPYRGK